MCEYYLLLVGRRSHCPKGYFTPILEEICALAEMLSRFSVHNNLENTQKYNLPFPEPAKRRKSKKRPRRKNEETKKDVSGSSPASSGK